jgi:hypothetical protein
MVGQDLWLGSPSGPDEAQGFVPSNHRAVLITRRPGGRRQTLPVLVGVDDEGRWSSRPERAPMTRATCDATQTVVLCVLSDDFFGRWMQIDGTARIVSLPERCRSRPSSSARRRRLAGAIAGDSIDMLTRDRPEAQQPPNS